jgi:8-oxo-dGTP pyrophosphatase MutT (NUDIX family)
VPLHEFTVGPEDQAELLAWLAGPRPDPATPRGSSTVLLLRPGAGPGSGSAADGAVEVFLLRRRASMAFAPRMHAFPGGGVDPRDSDADVPWAGPSPEEWAGRLHCPTPLASALVCAAVRETFEECGVLLAGAIDGAANAGAVVADVTGDDWERDRLALLDRSLSMSELLVRRGLRLRSDLLRPWAHWTTPEHESRRYDTWFFLAALPEGQHARDIGGESDRAHWAGLDDVLAGYARGDLPMYPPTAATIAEVVAAVRDRSPGQSGVEAALAAPREVRRVMPWLGRTPDGAAVMQVDLDGRGGGRPGPPEQCRVIGLP